MNRCMSNSVIKVFVRPRVAEPLNPGLENGTKLSVNRFQLFFEKRLESYSEEIEPAGKTLTPTNVPQREASQPFVYSARESRRVSN